MTDRGVEEQPSETALFAALRRAIAHKEYKNDRLGPDYLADTFLPPHFRFFLKFKRVRENTKTKLNEAIPGLTEYMIARTAYFDHLFVEALSNGTPQIVLLGAGYDSRAYRYSAIIRGTTIFELDIAPTQNRKKDCLAKARIDIPPQIKFVPINFREESILEVLEKAGFHPQEETLFLWEGVSYYLNAESVGETLAVVSQAAHHETSIAFDYTISVPAEKLEEYFGVREFSQTMKEHHGAEELLFSMEEGKTESFLEQRGLKILDHLDNKEIEQRFLLDDKSDLIGQITGHFRFVLAAKET
ncbi:MAG: SAM-dependent methyltransferase [Anaerolineales bacterium]